MRIFCKLKILLLFLTLLCSVTTYPDDQIPILRKRALEGEYLSILQPVLDYLHTSQSTYLDWTTSLPIAPPADFVRNAARHSCVHDLLHTYYNSELDENLLKLIESYFRNKDIPCQREQIVIRYSAFDILKDFYASLQLEITDEMLIFSPTYGYYIMQAAEFNIKVRLLLAREENNWKITPEQLEKALKENRNIKLLLLTNPVNPTGAFYTKNELEALSRIIKKYGIFVISDEIFSEICFDPDKKPYSIAAIKGMEKRTLTLSGLGKAKGIRLSFACLPVKLISQLPTAGILRPFQSAAIAALENNKSNKKYLEDNMLLYRKRVAFILQTINTMNKKINIKNHTKNVTYVKPFIIPTAANIFLISFPGALNKKSKIGVIKTALDLAKYIDDYAGVSTVPGEGFYLNPSDMVLRIPLSVSEKELEKGLEKILVGLLDLE